MRNRFSGVIFSLLVLAALLFSAFVVRAGAAEKVHYGGTLNVLGIWPALNPLCWDIADWCWKHGDDAGFVMDHLMMADLQKGSRGTKQYGFFDQGWIPSDATRGDILERWEVKKNPLQLILHLRKGVYWQEKPEVMKARELVASDVVYSIERRKNSRKATPNYLDFIGKIEIPDKYTVVINMTEWCADWQFRIGWSHYCAVQAPEQEKGPDGAGQWKNVTGTGPYMLTDYKDGHSETYTKNPKYWDSEVIDGKKYNLPFTDKLIMNLIKDEATQLASLRTGKIDLMMTMNWKYVAELTKSCPQLKWRRYLNPNFQILTLRMDQKPFNDIRVRRAMNLAVNKKEIADSFYGGNAEVYHYPFPPNFKEVYTPAEKLPPATRELLTYNPEKAKKLLVEAGYPNGFTFKCSVASSRQTLLDLAALVAGYLAKIGVTMELDVVDYPSHLSRMTKKTHPAGYILGSDYGGPLTIIRKNFTTGQTWNTAMFSDPYLDNTYTEASENPKLTDKQLFGVMKKLGVYALSQAPVILLPNDYLYCAWWPWVKNYYGETRVGANRGGPILARVWIDQELKKKMGY